VTKNTEHLSRKEKEEAFRRDLVLDAAESLFAEKGFDGTTVSDIASRSELAKGSLYQLFQSKEEIISAIIRRKVDRIWGVLDEVFRMEVSALEKIRNIMRIKLKAVWESRHFARIFLHELRGFHWEIETPLLDAYRSEMHTMMGRIGELLAEGQQAGEFRRDLPPSVLFAAMTGFSNAVIYAWLESGEEMDIETALDEAVELFLHGVCPREGCDLR